MRCVKKAVVLLSGGLDSATVTAVAKSKGFEIYAVTFDYGQRHRWEIKAAKKLASVMKVKKHLLLKIEMRKIGGSALTSNTKIPKKRKWSEMKKNVPATYVPARNTVFLSLALAWAETLGSKDIFIGANIIDFSGYPDCKPEYLKAFEKMANLAVKEKAGKRIRIHFPLIKMAKADIIKKGLKLGVDYSLTHTCYDPAKRGIACGECDACILRKKGFKEAKIVDPVRYAK